MSALEMFGCDDCGDLFYAEGMANSTQCWSCAGAPEKANTPELYAAALCGTCGRWWDDAEITDVTPAPSGRCPFEYDHPKET